MNETEAIISGRAALVKAVDYLAGELRPWR
jgi:hypothetical protein